jgi:hypothetical protein
MSNTPRKGWLKHMRHPIVTLSITGLGFLLCCTGLLLLASYNTTQAFAYLQKEDFATSQKYAQKSSAIVSSFAFVTAGLIPDLVVWQEALKLPTETAALVEASITIAEQSFQSDTHTSIEEVLPSIKNMADSLKIIEEHLPQTLLIKKQIPENVTSKLPQLRTGLLEAETVINSLSQGKQTWVVILQNSDELRATGVFPGSYVLLNFDNGALVEIVVEDIYDADGQFKGYVEAPSGIKEYTSGSNGLRLPDANWWPDFPTSAQTMLQFFALGDKNNIAGVVAVNLNTAKSILSVTGPLWLPDYKIEVNQENIGEVLRAERSEFFPGSSQKKHLLTLTLIQLKQKISQLTGQQQSQLFSEIRRKFLEKDIQLYSTQPTIQDIFTNYQVAGEISEEVFVNDPSVKECDCKPIVLSLVESNVGINKVNKYVSRSTELSFTPLTLNITTTFTNNSSPLSSTELSELVGRPIEAVPRNGNGYLNYYRLLISPEYSVDSILVGDVKVTTWDEENISTYSGLELKQIGVLLAVPEKKNNRVQFILTTKREPIPEVVVLFKQSGMPSTTYLIKTPQKTQEFSLDTDLVTQL